MQHCAKRATDKAGLSDYIKELAQVLQLEIGIANVSVLLINPTSLQLQQFFISDLALTPQDSQYNSKAAMTELFNGDVGNWMLANDSDCFIHSAQGFSNQHILTRSYQGIPLPEQLIGCLLKVENQVVGVLIVKCYKASSEFEQHQSLMLRIGYFLSEKIASNQREAQLQAFKDSQRRDLQEQLQQSAKAEELQRALYKVAALSTEQLTIDDFYRKVHQILGTLIDASNIGIIGYDEETSKLNYGYVQSCKQDDFQVNKEQTLGAGFSSYIIRERTAALLTPKDADKLVALGKITGLRGNQDFHYWMGAPLIFDGTVYGTVTLQSYDCDVIYNEKDLQLLLFLANHIARALAIHQKQQLQEQEQQRLKEQQALLEEQNAQINQTLKDLHLTEQALIKKEKI